MKTIKYRQYYYGGDYSEKELNLPDSCILYEVYMIHMSHKVKEEEGDIWAKSYILVGYEEFEDSELIGNIYFNDLSDVFITESDVPILNIEQAPKFENVYFTEHYIDSKAQAEFNELCRKLNEVYKKSYIYSEEDSRKLQEAGKRIKGIASIGKLRRFTPEGIEYSHVDFRTIFGGKEIIDMSINTIKYDRLSLIEFSTDENLAKMFRNRANEIYNNIINE